VRKWIWNAYKLKRQDGIEIEGEFSTWCLHAFTPRLGSQLEKNQEEWLEKNKDRLEEDKMDEETDNGIEEGVVGTLLFMEGEHGIGEREPEG
jgi:hypothetical protein